MAAKYTPEQREKIVDSIKTQLAKHIKTFEKELKKIDLNDDKAVFALFQQMKVSGQLISDISATLMKDAQLTS